MNNFNEKQFNKFRKENPNLRFFQALCNFTDKYIYLHDDSIICDGLQDTFYITDVK